MLLDTTVHAGVLPQIIAIGEGSKVSMIDIKEMLYSTHRGIVDLLRREVADLALIFGTDRVDGDSLVLWGGMGVGNWGTGGRPAGLETVGRLATTDTCRRNKQAIVSKRTKW